MFEGYFKDGERLEGNSFKEDGSFHGYLPYPPISIVGTWVAGDVLNNQNEIYGLTFNEDGTFQATDNKHFKGEYEFQNYNHETTEADIVMNVKGESGLIGGSISFFNKNQFSIHTTEDEIILFIREGSGGEIDY